ncbi:benzoate-CoA ligase family protein [Stappia taiwanensis]|uniref:Benzoate-CoA ligase family protein n=1 Tax=Stappia taiwanensis TaxID=992267 RepID=A0A838XUW0_9HYPH|nr:benzoate-CoA ligase family protein [Stappia taiwanensis]MBA4610854.1 benzoate-CoA ligase family protein [Stappia taiwanensis]GGE95318.1 acetyl-CoA synthetase [Stappia taiwanensis]
MAKSAHLDTFTADNLPPRAQWPDLINLDRLGYPERLNCASELIDRNVAEGRGDKLALVSPDERWTYAELAEKVNRIANVLVADFGLVPGNRVLLRFPNTPMMTAVYFAVLKAGGVVVATMPLLRAKELAAITDKAELSLAICDHRLAEEMELTRGRTDRLKTIVYAGGGTEEALETRMASASAEFAPCDTAAEDVCLLGFTSGTTGEPKATMHFHRDMLTICDCYSAKVLCPREDDVFIGSPPLAFTFGLGGLVLFPFRVGATAILLERAGPDELLAAIPQMRPTVLFTAPTAYRAILARKGDADLSSLRKCVSAGEALPKAIWDDWFAATGIRIMDGIGATELLHIFIAAREDELRPGATGKPVPGYEAKVIGPDGAEVPDGTPGRLAVRGPTGCRYLADDRQANYVVDGWNVTGDTYIRDADGYFWYQARSDDMIISAGYNIAGPEVEGTMLAHPAVAECGVVGAPDPERGRIVKAYVVLKPGVTGDAALIKELQDYIKAELAPYKYPRAVEFVDKLPRTETGKLQRFALREIASHEDTARAAS